MSGIVERNAEIVSRYLAGDPVKALAADYDLGSTQVYRVLRREAPADQRTAIVDQRRVEAKQRFASAEGARSTAQRRAHISGRLQRKPERNAAIIALVVAGKAASEIAYELKVSKKIVWHTVGRQRARAAAAATRP